MIFDPVGPQNGPHPSDGIRNNRHFLIATAVAFPIWWSVVFLSMAHREQGAWGKAQWAVLGIGLLVISAILLSRAMRNWMVDLMVGAGYLLTGFTFWLVQTDQLSSAFATTSFALVVLTSAVSRTKAKLVFYALFSLMLAFSMSALESKGLTSVLLPVWLAATFLITHLSMMDVMASQRALQRLFAATFVGAAVDDEGTVIDIHEEAAKIFGVEKQSVIGRPLTDLFYSTSHGFLKNYLKDGTEASMETLGVRKDGMRFLVELKRKFHVHQNRRLSFLSLSDISSRKESEVVSKGADRLSAIGTLAQTTGYDISNPLFVITGNLDLARKEIKNAQRDASRADVALANAVEYLDGIGSGADRLGGVVKHLKSLSIQGVQVTGPIDVNQVLEASLVAAPEAVRTKVRISKKFQEIPPVHGSAVLLEQVFVSLLANAAEAMESGDPAKNEIRLSTSVDPESSRVVVEVTDTGKGMDLALRKRIFDPFFTTRETMMGAALGLGLSICQKSILAMGGEITVDSVPQQGTTFRLFFPSTVPRKLSVKAAMVNAGVPTVVKRRRVLVVDDDAEICKLIQRVLGTDHDLDVITDSLQALKQVNSLSHYDAILCDLHMPEVTGMDLFEATRRSHPGVEHRFIFMTGGAFTQRSRDFLRSIPNHCAEKPINFVHLVKLLAVASPK